MSKCPYGYTSHGIREYLGMSQSEFSLTFGISVNTVRNWDSKSCMPIYVYRLLNLVCQYVPKDELQYMLLLGKQCDDIVKKADIH